MKRYGNLYAQVTSYENLLAAYQFASKNRKKRPAVAEFSLHLEENLLQIQRELQNHTYKTSPYTIFVIYEPKERVIFKLPFRDRVVHWAFMLIVEPIWYANFTRDTYSCIQGRGIHALLYKLRLDLKRDPEGTRYCLKVDIRKFYPSINHAILKKVIRKKIKDLELLNLMDGIIDSVEGETGVPIGNYPSQFWANLYLSELDHRMKEEIKVRYYYRFADDVVVLASSKEELSGILIWMNDYLLSERQLDLKRNYQIYPVESRGINYVGYITYHSYCLARKENKKKLCRQVSSLRKKGIPEEEIRLRTASRMGFMVHCNSRHLLKTIDMLKFSDIKPEKGNLLGTKYHIEEIVNKTIHLKGFKVSESKFNKEKCIQLQFDIYEELKDKEGKTLLKEDGTIEMGWGEHVTFTGSQALIKQLKGVEIKEPVACKIIKQPLERGKFFYQIVDPD